MKKYAKFLILALCCALVFSSTAYAAGRTKTMEVTYSDIKLVVDGNTVTPKDAVGTVVEPFIFEGTTYLPVRAVGEALGKSVSWDGNTSTIYVGAVPDSITYLLDVCPPYETKEYKAPDCFNMMGTECYHGFKLVADSLNMLTGFAYFNLNGQYSALEFDFGHVDGELMYDAEYEIYLDDNLICTVEGTSDMMVQHISIPLNGALQMKIIGRDTSYRTTYGFADCVLY